jgi:gliding motility-associated-like protein
MNKLSNQDSIGLIKIIYDRIIRYKIIKKASCLFLYVLLINSKLFSQNPGGIGTNIQLWLKANSNIVTTGANVTQWNNNVTGGIIANFVQFTPASFPTQNAPTFTSNPINFNPYIQFNGVNQSLYSNVSFNGNQLFNANDNTIFQIIKHYGTNGVWLKWETNTGGTNRVGYENNGSFLRFDFPNSINPLGINDLSIIPIINKHNLVTSTTDNTTNALRFQGKNDAFRIISSLGGFNPGTNLKKMSIGNNLSFNYPSQIDISEIIIYNRKLTVPEINKVESYLAIKYGFTLDQTTPQNYTSASGLAVWDGALNSGYNNDITGISREDASAQNQKQSRNNNLLDLVTVSTGSIALSNATNTVNLTNDNAFLIWGHNNQAVLFSNTNVPLGFGNRLERVWKAQQTNLNQNVTIAFEQSLLPSGTPTANVRLLIDDDGNFVDAKAISGATINAGRLEFANQNFDTNTKMFFTLAVCSSLTPVISFTNLCVGQPLLLTATPSYTIPSSSYNWSGPNAFTSSGYSVSIGSASILNQGIYTLTLSVNTCSMPAVTQSVTITNFSISATSATVCAGTTATLTANGATNYTWTPASALSSASGSVVTGSSMATSLFTVIGSANGCVASQVATINILNNPIISVSSETMCIGQSASLTANGAVSYTWSPSSNLSAANGSVVIGTPAATTTYSVFGESSDGCISLSTETINVINNPTLSVTSSSTICFGKTAILTAIGASSYTWSPAIGLNSNTGPTVISSPTTSMVYTVTGNLSGCLGTITSSVIVKPLPIVMINSSSNSYIYTPGEDLTLTGNGGVSYVWSNGSTDSNLVVYQTEQTQYCLEVTDANSCVNQTCVTVDLKTESTLYVPNSFTPNDDKINDVFFVMGTNITEFIILIFNSWGELLFESTDITKGWDGKYYGENVSNGIYVYSLKAKGIDGKKYKIVGKLNVMN